MTRIKQDCFILICANIKHCDDQWVQQKTLLLRIDYLIKDTFAC
jgi:hypothetical protein